MYNYDLGGLSSAESTLILKFLLFVLVSCLFSVAVRILFALAVNNDAKAIGVKNKTLWSVLEFFFPLIVGIIYLCTRNSLEKTVPRLCTSCGATMPPNSKVCYNCSGTALLDYKIIDAEKNIKRRKAFLISAIVVYVLVFVFSQIYGVKLVADLYKTYNNSNSSGSYEDYFDDYFDNFGKYFEQYGQEQNPPSDDNDFFDDFNNFGSGEEKDDGGENQMPDTDPFEFFDDFGD